MYINRQNVLAKKLKENNIDLALITSPINVFYYTGFHAEPHERFFALAIDVVKQSTTLFLPKLDEEAGRANAKVTTFVPITDTEDAYSIFKEHIGSAVQSIAMEKNIVTVTQYELFQKYCEGVTFHGLDEFIIEERRRKSADEIENTKKAIEMTEHGLGQILPKIKIGMKENEIKALLEHTLKNLGADGIAFDTIVLTGEHSAQPHGMSGDRAVEEGDFLLFDFGVTVNGYHSDITRTFIIGGATEEQKKIYDAVLKANEAAIAAVKVGNLLKDIDIAARDAIEKAGYGEYFIHRTGHGLGLEVHELPSIHDENESPIEPGLLFTIEPGIYFPGIGGVRIEDNIYIDESGKVDILTTFPKSLTVINGK